MKIYYFLIPIILIGITVLNYPREKSEEEYFYGASYYKRTDGIYYGDKKLKRAYKDTFQLINKPIWSEYAQDSSHAFGFGKELKWVDLKSFKVLSFRYAKDLDAVYCFGDRIVWADAATFENTPFMDMYARDKNHIYYNCDILEGLDPASFEVLKSNTIVRDKEYIFCDNTKMKDVDAWSFSIVLWISKGTEPVPSEYSKDKNHVYFWCHILDGADSGSFKTIDVFIGKDKNHTYANWEILQKN